MTLVKKTLRITSLVLIIFCFFSGNLIFASKARYWCHDYSIGFVNGRQTIGTNVNELRDALGSKCNAARYVKSTYKSILDLRKVALNPGDVIIIGEKHSGVVTSGRKINHFFGETYTDVEVKSWTVDEFNNFKRTKNIRDGSLLSKPVFPYRNTPVQVWKKVKPKTHIRKISINPDSRTIKLAEKVSFDAVLYYDDGTKEVVTDDASWMPGNEFTGTKPGSYSITASCGGLSGKAVVVVEDSIAYYLTETNIYARINGVSCKTRVYHCAQCTREDVVWAFNVYKKMFEQERMSAETSSSEDDDCVKTQKILDMKQSIAQGPSSSPITVPRPSTDCPCSNSPVVQYQLSQEYDPRCSTYEEFKQMKELLKQME